MHNIITKLLFLKKMTNVPALRRKTIVFSNSLQILPILTQVAVVVILLKKMI